MIQRHFVCRRWFSLNGTAVFRHAFLILILTVPSLYIFLTLPPLWRDEDAFNEIASTFAPRGIIHYLPGYCLGGRLIVCAGTIVGSLAEGHGIPSLSINLTPINDAGIYTLVIAQHLLLVLSLWYAVRTLSRHFPMRVLFAICFALTPCLYIYANCIGSEAFSNPLVYLVAACGWDCIREKELNSRKVLIYFGLLVAAALTRQINAVLIAALPIALLPLAGKELIRLGMVRNSTNRKSRFRYTRLFLIFVVVGLTAIGTSLLVQQTMCCLYRVPFRSTFGETFSYRLNYLGILPEQERTEILAGISSKVGDPVVTEALDALNRSLNQGERWTDMFLYYKIDEILFRNGFSDRERRTWQIHLKLNRVAACVLFSGDPDFQSTVWRDFVLSPFFVQSDLAYPPFELTDWVHQQLAYPRYERLRGLASFQHPEGYYKAAWLRLSYAHLFKRVPMLEMACLAVALAIALIGLGLISRLRDPVTEAGAWYAAGMIVTGLLVSFFTCLSTYFQGRLYLPVYSLFQMGMMLAVAMTADVLRDRVGSFKKVKERFLEGSEENNELIR
jgi:hypothetical protein